MDTPLGMGAKKSYRRTTLAAATIPFIEFDLLQGTEVF
jgi:hypothetical protein